MSLIVAEPTPLRMTPERVAQFLEKTLKELDGCQSDLDIQRVSSKLESVFTESSGCTRGNTLKAIQKAELTLRQDGQLVKANRMANVGKLMKKLPNQSPKKQRKALRKILQLCAKNVGVNIGKRSLCCGSNSLLCNAAVLTGSVLAVAGATTFIVMAASGLFDDPTTSLNEAGLPTQEAEEGVVDDVDVADKKVNKETLIEELKSLNGNDDTIDYDNLKKWQLNNEIRRTILETLENYKSDDSIESGIDYTTWDVVDLKERRQLFVTLEMYKIYNPEHSWQANDTLRDVISMFRSNIQTKRLENLGFEDIDLEDLDKRAGRKLKYFEELKENVVENGMVWDEYWAGMKGDGFTTPNDATPQDLKEWLGDMNRKGLKSWARVESHEINQKAWAEDMTDGKLTKKYYTLPENDDDLTPKEQSKKRAIQNFFDQRVQHYEEELEKMSDEELPDKRLALKYVKLFENDDDLTPEERAIQNIFNKRDASGELGKGSERVIKAWAQGMSYEDLENQYETLGLDALEEELSVKERAIYDEKTLRDEDPAYRKERE